MESVSGRCVYTKHASRRRLENGAMFVWDSRCWGKRQERDLGAAAVLVDIHGQINHYHRLVFLGMKRSCCDAQAM